MSKSREEVEHYLKKVLGFVRVRTLTPGRRLYAHLVPGTKGLWIPIELERGEKSITNFVMDQVRHMPPNPRPIPKNFRIRKVNKKLVIEESPPKEKPKAKPKREYPRPRLGIPKPRSLNNAIRNASHKVVYGAINRITAEERKARRNSNERSEMSRKLVQNAINKITAEEKEIKKFVASMMNRVVARQKQEERNRLPAPTTVRPYAGPRVRTSARDMYEHKTPSKQESSTYKRLRGEGLSERQARALINSFGYDSEPEKEKEENLANYLEHWEREALKYGPREEGEGYDPGPVEPFRRLYGSSKQIPVQTRRKHRPDYKLYSSYR